MLFMLLLVSYVVVTLVLYVVRWSWYVCLAWSVIMQCFIMDELYIAFVCVAACYSKTLGDVLLAHIISFILPLWFILDICLLFYWYSGNDVVSLGYGQSSSMSTGVRIWTPNKYVSFFIKWVQFILSCVGMDEQCLWDKRIVPEASQTQTPPIYNYARLSESRHALHYLNTLRSTYKHINLC